VSRSAATVCGLASCWRAGRTVPGREDKDAVAYGRRTGQVDGGSSAQRVHARKFTGPRSTCAVSVTGQVERCLVAVPVPVSYRWRYR
jgi:hypothetical protein